MRLDHLLSKDWLCGVASWSCVVWIVEWVWAGWGALPLRKAGQLTVSRGFVLAGWLVCLVIGVGNTPAAACWVVVGAPACLCACGGGMLSGFWGSAPWLPDPSGLLICWGLWVGWL